MPTEFELGPTTGFPPSTVSGVRVAEESSIVKPASELEQLV